MKTVTLPINADTFFLPVTEYLSTYHARSTEQTRYYLNGVFCEFESGVGFHMVATDGHLLIRHSFDTAGAHIGENIASQKDATTRGFILDLDVMEKAFKSKGTGPLWMHGDLTTGILQVVDGDPTQDTHARVGVCEFSRIDGHFPDYRRVMPAPGEPVGPFALDLTIVDKIRKALAFYSTGKDVKASFHSVQRTDPVLIKSLSCPGFTAVQMPIRF